MALLGLFSYVSFKTNVNIKVEREKNLGILLIYQNYGCYNMPAYYCNSINNKLHRWLFTYTHLFRTW